MNRNPIQRTCDEVRYTKSNPPENEEAAQTKLEQLKTDAVLIETDLEHKRADTFNDASDYGLWHKRAVAALGYKKRDIAFLECWLRDRDAERLRVSQVRTVHTVGQRLADFVKAYDGDQCPPIFGIHYAPKDLEAAKQRLAFLTELQVRGDRELTDVRSAIVGDLAEKDLLEVERPVKTLLRNAGAEIHYLRGYVHANAPEDGTVNKVDRAEAVKWMESAALAKRLADEILETRPLPYGPENPPSSLEEAKQRFDALPAMRSGVHEAIGRLSSAWDAPSGVPKWTKRPLIELLRLLDLEAGYLKTFIREERGRVAAAEKTTRETEVLDAVKCRWSASELNELSDAIRARASKLAATINEGYSYTPTFTSEHLPQNLDEAKSRMGVVLEVRLRVQEALTEITDTWGKYPFRREHPSLAKRPLTNILQAVESEIRVLKAFIKAHTVVPKYLRWKSVCVAALTRAVFGGFVLTQEEQEVVQALLAEIAASTDPDP